LKGYRLWAMGQLDSACRAVPRDRTTAYKTKRTKKTKNAKITTTCLRGSGTAEV
jgi:transcriptional regulatory protein LevR